ncbi:unnamed protein product [Urochloa decumbens]|uniref:Nucleolar essential protein 1 n=1 Tax=Urochloa decumbens TaxID=240449 RepID=A0ABC8ZM46_9POAL
MGQPYAVKGRKKKRKLDEAAALDAAPPAEEAEEPSPPEEVGGEDKGEEEDEEHAAVEGLPVVPRPVDGMRRPGAIFVLERACLEVGKVGKAMQILNSDDHANYLRKQNRNPADYRPDIIHQALLAIFDSPLTKAGRLQAVYVRTEKGVLFEIKPYVRMPRTFKRFCGLMSQLLQKLSITAVGKRDKLLNVVKNPVTRYLPVGARKAFHLALRSLSTCLTMLPNPVMMNPLCLWLVPWPMERLTRNTLMITSKFATTLSVLPAV